MREAGEAFGNGPALGFRRKGRHGITQRHAHALLRKRAINPGVTRSGASVTNTAAFGQRGRSSRMPRSTRAST
jgi:hypothetical protein